MTSSPAFTAYAAGALISIPAVIAIVAIGTTLFEGTTRNFESEAHEVQKEALGGVWTILGGYRFSGRGC